MAVIISQAAGVGPSAVSRQPPGHGPLGTAQILQPMNKPGVRWPSPSDYTKIPLRHASTLRVPHSAFLRRVRV